MSEPDAPTLTDLALKIGVERSTLSSFVWDRRKVGTACAQKIAAYLNAPDWRRFVHMPGEELRREIMGR